MPFWAMGALSLLPIWGFIYVRGVQPIERKVVGPLGEGAAVYANCQSCHGPDGAGGAGRPLKDGEVLKTFPKIEDQLNFVYNGSAKYKAAGVAVIGDPNRAGGAHTPLAYNGNPMPQQGSKAGGALTDAQILAVVCHERYTLAGGDEASEEFTKWCSPTSEIFTALNSGAATFDTVEGVGTEPRASAG